MLQIKFHPDSDKEDVSQAVTEYQLIWNKEGLKFIEAIEKTSDLKFVESFINAIVLEWPSNFRPLCFRASDNLETKKATLIHELCHRLISGNRINIKGKMDSLESHKDVDLILYDIWIYLFGEEFAKRHVELECQYRPFYKQAWDWTMTMTAEERKVKFKELCSQ